MMKNAEKGQAEECRTGRQQQQKNLTGDQANMKKQKAAPITKDEMVATTLSEVMAIVEVGKLDKILASNKGVTLIKAFTQFAEIDYQSETQSPLAGELFSKILAMPLDEQKKLVWAIADQKKIERPSYVQQGAGRPTMGRNELAAVLYSDHPDMLEKQGNKDSKASKRITDHVRRYLIKSGQKTARQTATTEGEKPKIGAHTMKVMFVELWNVGQSESERRTLVALYLRLGALPEQMNKWTESGLLSLATSSLGAIDVQASHVG